MEVVVELDIPEGFSVGDERVQVEQMRTVKERD